MSWLQEVEVVEIRYLAEYGSIREALRIARLARTMPVAGRRMRMPSLRIVADEYRDEEREEAGYPLIIEAPLEGYKNEQAESESYEGDRWEVMLQPSYTSLKRLDIQLDDKTSLGGNSRTSNDFTFDFPSTKETIWFDSYSLSSLLYQNYNDSQSPTLWKTKNSRNSFKARHSPIPSLPN
ncbi:hypothetical protein JCM5353_000917 [Sporobolomyces roseus]